MKKGIECGWGNPVSGCPCLVIEKEKGALTRDEIEDAARQTAPGMYALIVDASAENVFPRIDAGKNGDTAFLLDMGKVSAALQLYDMGYLREEAKA